ncbi:MAG: enoyl-CoA hydratase-related protein, partial [Aestuariivirgaceae bacterium]
MTKPKFEHLLVADAAPQVLLVTLNRPEVANAFNTQMARDVIQVFEDLALDLGDVRCVVLTGA